MSRLFLSTGAPRAPSDLRLAFFRVQVECLMIIVMHGWSCERRSTSLTHKPQSYHPAVGKDHDVSGTEDELRAVRTSRMLHPGRKLIAFALPFCDKQPLPT